MAAPDAPAAPLDRAVEEARKAYAAFTSFDIECSTIVAGECARTLGVLLAALDADRGEAEKTLKWIEVHEAFHYSDDRTWALALKDAARRYFARREGEERKERG